MTSAAGTKVYFQQTIRWLSVEVTIRVRGEAHGFESGTASCSALCAWVSDARAYTRPTEGSNYATTTAFIQQNKCHGLEHV